MNFRLCSVLKKSAIGQHALNGKQFGGGQLQGSDKLGCLRIHCLNFIRELFFFLFGGGVGEALPV